MKFSIVSVCRDADGAAVVDDEGGAVVPGAAVVDVGGVDDAARLVVAVVAMGVSEVAMPPADGAVVAVPGSGAVVDVDGSEVVDDEDLPATAVSASSPSPPPQAATDTQTMSTTTTTTGRHLFCISAQRSRRTKSPIPPAALVTTNRRPARMAAIPAAGPLVLLEVVWPSRVEALGDEGLLAAVALGDRHAMTVFVRRFQRKVYGLAASITLDDMLAEDVAQLAFERAWRHAATYDARRGQVSTWLLTITRNLAIDAIRVRRPQPFDPSVVAALLPPNDTADPATAAINGDRLARLRVALDSLPEEQRRAVLLTTIGCRTSTEIAETEGVPIPTAKHRIQSGLRKLRAALVNEVES